jgi:hypothetical protein
MWANSERASVLSLVHIYYFRNERSMHAWPQPRSAAADGIQATQRRKPRHTRRTHAPRRRWQSAHYRVQRSQRSSVPSPNVLVESRRREERLRTEPRALKEPSPHELEPDGQCSTRRVQWAECERSEVLALDSRDPAQLRRLDVGKPEGHSVISLVRIIILEK